MSPSNRARRAASIALLLAVGTASGAPALASANVDETVAALKRATEKYLDVEAALADGYVPEPTNSCVTAEMEGQPRQLGAMGIHYVRPDLLGLKPPASRVDGTGIHTDFEQPAVLVYEPQADGSLQLVAIENLVFAKAWHDAGNTAPPEFMGNQYFYMIDNPLTPVDEAHGFEPHYELHAWVHRENPSGVFSPFNPNGTCEHHVGGHAPPAQ